MLKQRVLTAIVGIPILLLVLLSGSSALMTLFLLAVVGICCHEAASMLMPKLDEVMASAAASGAPVKTPKWLVILPMVAGAVLFLAFTWGSPTSGKALLLVTFLMFMAVAAFGSQDNHVAVGRMLGLILVLSYAALPWVAMWDLYRLGEHSRYVLLTLVVVWSGDTAAYFGGRAFGRVKLAPRMSPNKTREGAVFGLLGSIGGAFALNAGFDGELCSWSGALAIGLFGGATGQVGDLIESVLKRFAGVKDSGRLFPGHGGILDRVDGLLFAAPVIWFILYIL